MFGRFGRRFGPFMRDGWEGGPPWMQPEWRGPRGPWGPGGPGGHRGPGGHWRGGFEFSPEQAALRSTAAEVARLFAIASRSSTGNKEKQAQLRSFLERSRKELSDIIYESGQATVTDGPANIEQA